MRSGYHPGYRSGNACFQLAELSSPEYDKWHRVVAKRDFIMSASIYQQSEVLDDQGFRPVSLFLNEPFEIIVANNPLWKVERTANGETVFMSPTGGKSGVRNSGITFQLENWARSNGGMAFDSSTLFRLPNGALRSPDGCWLQTERWQSLTEEERESYPVGKLDSMMSSLLDRPASNSTRNSS